jgi:hypothetical protein
VAVKLVQFLFKRLKKVREDFGACRIGLRALGSGKDNSGHGAAVRSDLMGGQKVLDESYLAYSQEL